MMYAVLWSGVLKHIVMLCVLQYSNVYRLYWIGIALYQEYKILCSYSCLNVEGSTCYSLPGGASSPPEKYRIPSCVTLGSVVLIIAL